MKSKNLFKLNGVTYTDNIANYMSIGITKEQYCKYQQLEEKIKLYEDVIQEARMFLRQELLNKFNNDRLAHPFYADLMIDSYNSALSILDKAKKSTYY